MTDQYPENFEIEIDRDALYKYLFVKYLGNWIFGPLFVACFITLFSAGTYADNHDPVEIQSLVFVALTSFGIGLLAVAIVVVPAFLVFVHFMVGNAAKHLHVAVEGAFLHIVQENFIRVDRKLHFRAITDYSTVEGCLMRYFGLMALKMTTIGGSRLDSTIQIVGIKDCMKVRDMLAEIDSMRENA